MTVKGIWPNPNVTNPQVEDHDAYVRVHLTSGTWSVPDSWMQDGSQLRSRGPEQTCVSVSGVRRSPFAASGKSKGSETVSPGPNTSRPPIVTLPHPRHGALWLSAGRAGKVRAVYVKVCVEVYWVDTESLACDENRKRITSTWAKKAVAVRNFKMGCVAPVWS